MRKTIQGSPGLQTAPNAEMVQPGALKQAIGCMIRRTGLIEVQRPWIQLAIGNIQYSGFPATWLASYNNFLYLGNNGTTIWRTNFSSQGSVTAPVACSPADTFAMRHVEANGNLYLGTSNGIVKLDAHNGTPYRAGVPRALDIQLTLLAGTLLANTNSAGYRVLFGFKDANANLILGPPSGRYTVTAASAQNVTVKAWIPAAITGATNATSYFVQVYRTSVQLTAGVDPGEEMQLVYQAYLTSTDVSNKYISVTDACPDGIRGAALYASPSQEGIAAANYPPPIAIDHALFKGSVFYANTTQKHTARLQLTGISANTLTISTGAGGITKSGGNGVYTFTGSPDLSNIPTDGTAKLSSTGNTSAANNGEFPITAVDNVGKTITVTNAAAVTEAGTANSRGFPSKLTIAAVNYYGSINGTETVASQIYKVATAGSGQQNVVDTCASLLRVVNQQTSPAVYGYYDSGPDDGAGKMLFEAVSLGASQFSISAAGTLWYNSFNPTIPSAGAVTSTNDAAINRVYIAKQNQPEHVPLSSYLDIGSRTKAILRLIPLREALIVFKADGVFRIIGDGAGNFVVAPLDYSVQAISASTITTLANRAYCVAKRGAVMVSETSTTLISGPIADKFAPWVEGGGAAYTTWASEVDQAVIYYVIPPGGPPVEYVYNAVTGAWTQGYMFLGFGGYQPIIYAGLVHATLGSKGDIWRESVVADQGTPESRDSNMIRLPTATTGSGTITIDATQLDSGYANGFLIVGAVIGNFTGAGGTQNLMNVTAVNSSVPSATIITLTPNQLTPSADAGAFAGCYIFVPQQMTVEWVPQTSGDDGTANQFREVSVLFDPSSNVVTGGLNMYSEATTSIAASAMTLTNTPLPAGVTTQSALRSLVPLTMRYSRRLSVVFTHSAVGEYVALRGVSYEYEDIEGSREVS